MNETKPVLLAALTVAALAAWACTGASAQTAPAPAVPGAAPAPAASPLEALAWLRGCWKGTVNRREFREQWSPPRGGMMVGISHTVVAASSQATPKPKLEKAGSEVNPADETTQDFEYLRLEERRDGVYYLDIPSGKKELAFRLTDVADVPGAKVFTFTNTVDEFPDRLVYRRGAEGWLYAQVMAKPGTQTNDVTYPMQHVDCQTDALLQQ